MAQDPRIQGGEPIARPGSGQIDRAVENVFEDPELQRQLVVDGGGIQDLWQWLLQLFFDVLLGLEAMRLDNPVLYWLILTALIAVLCVLIFHIVWTLRRALRSPTATAPRTDSGPAAERAQLSRELRARARQLAAAGELREAVRYLLLALLALVEERNVLHVARGWTNREILQRLGARVELGAQAQTFNAVAERASYGGALPAPEDFAAMDRFLDGVEQEVRAR